MTKTDLTVKVVQTEGEVRHQRGKGWGAAWSLMPWAEYGDVFGTVNDVIISPAYPGVVGIGLGTVGEKV